MFGLSLEKIVIVLAVAAFIIGPQRLPEYAAKLATLVKTVKSMADGAKDRITSEMGPEFQDTDWKKLDPRQYDPRRIIRTALLDDEPMPVIGRPSQRQEPSAKLLPGEDFQEPAA